MIYEEDFNDGPGGWYGWGFKGAERLAIVDGAAVSRSPWWVDINHAPPGAGYLHLLYVLNTSPTDSTQEIADTNRFQAGGFPCDFTNARITVRVRGNVAERGADMVLLAQGDVTEPRKTRVNSVLTGQPIRITRDWSEQTIVCAPDNGQWTPLGSRHNRTDLYGWGPVAPLLRSLNLDIIFVLFPLDVRPVEPVTGDIHVLRADGDYKADRRFLPEGEVWMDWIRIEFAGHS
jgi:hypothetical protein